MNERFHLEINSFEEFVKFVALIRGEDVDPEEIKKLSQTLNLRSDALIETIKNSTKKEKM